MLESKALRIVDNETRKTGNEAQRALLGINYGKKKTDKPKDRYRLYIRFVCIGNYTNLNFL